MEMVWLLHIQSGLPDDDADILKHLRVLTMYIYIYIYIHTYIHTYIYNIINTFTAIVDLSRSNFSIARTPLFQLKSAM